MPSVRRDHPVDAFACGQPEVDRFKRRIGPFLKFDTPWYSLFRDLEPGVSGTWVNAVVDVGNKSYLFSGIVDDFHVDKEGGLDRIILIEASQQLLPAGAEEQGNEEEPQLVEGKLVLRYSTIKTMTVDTFTVDTEESETYI